ncbi:NAC domain-containing protein 14 [Gossypium raimondii]|uniref:Uncharacterized protein n=1 Tax=Gossypium raimondii TaxID=29730 RepID=A0A0D2RZP8_GOSRA|nr:NAC domain-containing protein 14 [Gossypium raimondii]KJB37434.1 hypothetical protein B456_006G204100 [Gossypium raimondii]
MLEPTSLCNNQILKNFGTETGIRIRSRGPQQRPSPDNAVNQGTAPRRRRLQTELSTGPMKVSAGSADDDKVRSGSLGEEEVQSALTEVTEAEATGETSSSDESDNENEPFKFDGSGGIAEESSTKPRQRVKQDGEEGSGQMGPSVHHHHRSSTLLFLAVIIMTIVIVLVMGNMEITYILSYSG